MLRGRRPRPAAPEHALGVFARVVYAQTRDTGLPYAPFAPGDEATPAA